MKDFYCQYTIGSYIFAQPVTTREDWLYFIYCLKRALSSGRNKSAIVSIVSMDDEKFTVHWLGEYTLFSTPVSCFLKPAVWCKEPDFRFCSMWGK